MPLRSLHQGTRRRATQVVRFGALLVLLALLVLPVVPAAAAPAGQALPKVSIKILPIDRARFVPGQRFDLRVEVTGEIADNTDPGTFAVTINGRPASQVLGKEPEKTNSTPHFAELTWRQVSLTSPGVYSVSVNAGGVVKTVAWEVLKLTVNGKPAKNVILFVGDGMAWQMLTIARIVSKGLTEGKFNGYLNMDQMEEVGYATTSGYDSLVTDSANGASAFATGHKSVVNAMGVYQDNTASPFDDPRVENVTELLQRAREMSIGLVTTSEIEDATPAAMVAHTRRRAEKQAIADALLEAGHQPEVILGGGAAYFIPKSTAGSKRTDERNLLGDFQAAGYTLAANRAELNAAPDSGKLLGLFHPSDMNVWVDREYTKDPAVLGPYTDQPTLYEMTQKAINILSKDQDGFFLMVEGASIDKQLHPMDWERAAGDVIEFDKAIGIAKAFAAQRNDTLIVVTADHSHSVSVYGTYDTTQGPGNPDAIGVYADAKWPTFSDANGDGFPDSWNPSRTLAVGFGNHPAYTDDFVFNPAPLSPTIQDPSAPKGTTKYIPNPKRDPNGVLMGANLPAFEGTEVHSADDVPLLASGPGARYFHGIHDNTDVFFGIVSALGVSSATQSRGDAGAPLTLGFVTIGLTTVVGASRYLRRPGVEARGPVSHLLHTAARYGSALQIGVRSFRAALRRPDDGQSDR